MKKKQNKHVKLIVFGIVILATLIVFMANFSIFTYVNAINKLDLAVLGIADLLVLAMWIIILNLVFPHDKSKKSF